MSRHSIHALSFCLIGAGLFVWTQAGRPLISNSELKVPLNPLGINGSPYGEVLAMAMQGPIDTYFHGAMGTGVHHHHSNDETCDACNKQPAADSNDFSKPKIFRNSQPEAAVASTTKPSPSKLSGFEGFLASLSKLDTISTNPKAPSEAHRLYLRRKSEDKLRFAYRLDPSHYGNYNSLNFFLTEPAVGTRPELNQSVAKLAEETIQYCLKQEHDPRPALTAAAAATNILQLMFADQQNEKPKFNTTQMRHFLKVLDYSLARYDALAREWDASQQWNLISPQRITECEDRYSFIRKIRDASEKTILRFEGHPEAQVSN